MIHIHDQQVVGVAQVINKMNGGVFNKKDEEVYIIMFMFDIHTCSHAQEIPLISMIYT